MKSKTIGANSLQYLVQICIMKFISILGKFPWVASLHSVSLLCMNSDGSIYRLEMHKVKRVIKVGIIVSEDKN
jgi:hypothetical protein